MPAESTTNEPLTPAQQRTLGAIAAYIQEYGYGPTNRDLAARQGFSSTNAIRDQLRELARKGYISRAVGLPRTITLVSQPAAEAVA